MASKPLSAFDKVIGRIVRALNYIGMSVLLLVVFFMTLDVVMRYVFNRPLRGSFEIGELSLVVVTCLAFSYTALLKGHVNIDYFTSRMSVKKQAVLNVVNNCIGIAIYSMIAWRSLDDALYVMAKGQTLDVLRIPVYPFKLLVPFGCFLLCLVLIAQIRESISQIGEVAK